MVWQLQLAAHVDLSLQLYFSGECGTLFTLCVLQPIFGANAVHFRLPHCSRFHLPYLGVAAHASLLRSSQLH